MSKTAEFGNQVLKVYISRDDIKTLLTNNWIFCDLFYQGKPIAENQVYLSLNDQALNTLRGLYDQEAETIDQAKRERQNKVNERTRAKRKAADHAPEERLPDPSDPVSETSG